MNEEALRQHFESIGVDNGAAAELYTDDAILEYVQSGERIRGRAAITASRNAYPGRRTYFRMRGSFGAEGRVAVELTMFVDGDEPHPVVAILEARDGRICRERLYICEPWEAPAYRAQWAERLLDD